MVLREQDKHFLWSLYAVVGIIFIWKGLWDGIYEIPYLGNPWVALFVGLAMLTFSGIIFKEFDPLGGLQKATDKVLHEVRNHPHQEEFTFIYQDNLGKKEVKIGGEKLKGIERGALIMKHKNQKKEIFIPVHRITEVKHKGQTYWRL